MRSEVRSAEQVPEALMRVCSSPSNRFCLPKDEFWPSQAENLRQASRLQAGAANVGALWACSSSWRLCMR